MRQRYILGKAYVINEESPIVCVARLTSIANSILIHPYNKTSNPVFSSRSIGGVGRNIAEI